MSWSHCECLVGIFDLDGISMVLTIKQARQLYLNKNDIEVLFNYCPLCGEPTPNDLDFNPTDVL